MSAALTLPGMEAEARSRKLSQFFTPVELAARIWEWSGATRASRPLRVLDPSCGSGNLIAGMLTAGVTPGRLDAIDVDADQTLHCAARFKNAPWLRVFVDSFDPSDGRELTAGTLGRYDIAVMNPPYEDNATVRFCARALELCDRVIAVLPADVFYTGGRLPFWQQYAVHRRVNLSFRPKFGAQGGQINSVVLELRKRRRPLALGQPQTVTEEWW